MPDVLRFEPTVTVLLVLMVVGIVGGADLLRRVDLGDRRGAWATLLLWVWVGAVLAVGLSPVNGGGDRVNTTPLAGLAGDPFALTNLALTIALFAVAGLLVVGLRPVRPGMVLVALLALAVGLELAQHYAVAGHSADANDIVGAVAGLTLGYLVGVLLISAAGRLRSARRNGRGPGHDIRIRSEAGADGQPRTRSNRTRAGTATRPGDDSSYDAERSRAA